MNAFKSQQFRWAKGSIQVAKKLLPTIWRTKDVSFSVKLEAFFHLTNNFAYPLLLLLSILLLPNLLVRTQHGWREVLLIDLPLFFGTTLSIASFYITSQREIQRNWKPTLRRLPLMMSLGIGLCINQTRAVVEALFGGDVGRVRAHAQARRRAPLRGLDGEEATARPRRSSRSSRCCSRSTSRSPRCWRCSAGHYVSLPFLLLFTLGFGYVGVLSLHQSR